jgi:tyrosyl-tRNA synthetase
MLPGKDLALLKRGAKKIISERELKQKLALGQRLRVKLGVDPTSPDIHLGHSIVLRKLRQFQDLGHQAVLIIGDFTARIGDPSGRTATRPQITEEEVLRNADTYWNQALKILDSNPNKIEIVLNGKWFRKMNFEDIVRLTSRVTLQQMLQRDDFDRRIKKQRPIHAHEILYPIMQGWDSVMVKADVELGGTDQLFNILIGRDFQKEEGQPQQVVFLLPILEGLDGSKKMSKSLNNYVGLTDAPHEMFGKLMSISDKLMARYYRLLLERPLDKDEHPMEAKKELAFEIVETYHSRAAALQARDDWNARFGKGRLATADLPEFLPSTEEFGSDLLTVVYGAYSQSFGIEKSRSDIRRLILGGSVQLNGKKILDPQTTMHLESGQVLRLDKTRAVRIF